MSIDGVPLAMQKRHYDVYIKPLLKVDPPDEYTGFLMWQGYEAWRVGVREEDLNNLQFVEWICEQMAKDHLQDSVDLFSQLVEEDHNSGERLSAATHTAGSRRMEGSEHEKFRTMLGQYGALFESEFRLWATVPYFFACQYYKIPTKGSTMETYLRIGASEKYRNLKRIKTPLPQGDLAALAGNFDVNLRNAGPGHDSWEITDDGSIELTPIEPTTGKPKSTGKIRFTEQKLRDAIRACSCTVWVLRMGCMIFLVNNPQIASGLKRSKPMKKAEIRAHLASFAEDRSMKITYFDLDDERKHLSMTQQHVAKVVRAEGGRMFFGKGEEYAIVQREIKGKYKYLMWSMLQMVIRYFPSTELPFVKLTMLDEEGETVSSVEVTPVELKKLYGERSEENVPIPQKGEWPEEEYTKLIELPVSPDQKEKFETFLKQFPSDEDGLEKAMKQWGVLLGVSI